MSGTAIGAAKSVKKIKAEHGEDFFKRIGSIGGKRGHTGGFYKNSERARAAGSKGGAVSKRGPSKPYPGEIRVAYSAGTTAIPITITPLNFWGKMRRLWKTL